MERSTKTGYLDGVSEATQAATGLIADDTAPFVVGGDPAPGETLFFKGAVDDVVFYDRVLTTTEIAQLIVGS